MVNTDLFAPLERILAKYRRDVHQLSDGAGPETLTALEAHLRQPLPDDLRQFLSRYNGAQLFRGTLRLRSAQEMAPANAHTHRVTLFADGPGECRWAFAPNGRGGRVFGIWENERLQPLHASFRGWLAATILLLDSRILRPEDQDALRLEADPEDAVQILRAGERALLAGNPQEAEPWLRRASQRDPGSPLAWVRLGDALAVSDRSAARMAWLQALRCVRLPLLWPGAESLEPELIRSAGQAFNDPQAWESELERFLGEQVADVTSPEELDIAVAAHRELARSRVRRGRRAEARQTLSDLLSRCRLYQWKATPWAAVLELARLETDLGHHDEAEALLRRIRQDDERARGGAALVALARIAIARQEPWAEEILAEATAFALDDVDRLEMAVLHVERSVRQERLADAQMWRSEARRIAQRLPTRVAEPTLVLAETDVLRLEGELGPARDMARRGIQVADEREDAEVLYRLHLRAGDLGLALGKQEEAHEAYRVAAEGFGRHELPVREGWALMRLARLSRDGSALLGAARDRFLRADLAAGVAAVDAILGDPAGSLPWHLQRASDHARARHDAQRSKPPYERADADRPERRLGAHRLAIAACSDGVVHAIAREMDSCARAISTGRGRPLDPPVLQYVAAVDLLSGHRSYPAAQVLLRHLLQGVVEGTALRALQGAIARSPNAALVDGLLSCVENPSAHPADAVAAAAEVLGLRRERAALRALVQLTAPGANPLSRKAAVVAVGRIGDRSVTDRLHGCLDEPILAEQAALALLMLGDRHGIDFHGRALADGRADLSGSPGEIVGRYGGPAYLLLLVRSAEGTDDRAIGALQGLGLMGDPRAVPTLLKGVAHRDRRVSEIAAGSLQILTGHAEDIEEAGGRHRWVTWWEQNEHRFKDGVRHRDGRVFDAGLLLQRMDHHDPWVRRTAYDELVITSGCGLPFDSDGPWRVQRAHARAWQEWWRDARVHQLPGQWFLDGKPIS
jgi:tetratricopeptide (TPR) repeat protein